MQTSADPVGRVAIRAEGLGKKYHIGAEQRQFRTLSERIAHSAKSPFRRAGKLLRGQATGASELDEEIWALRNLSFEVLEGEVVGVIGGNGAGKSTLLKVVSRITEPTEGHVDIYGSVGSLLEVGTGFHPELTGRENVYLNGAILGMHRAEIAGKFDEIVEFAEVRKFMDTPVKHYSSGMYVRLAFAVAAHLDPDILLVDEVLSVGDASFQRKCLGKMGDVAKRGRTVLFVSHNMAAIFRLCDRAIWLDEGLVRITGNPTDVIATYLASTTETSGEREWREGFSKPGIEEYRLEAVRVLDARGQPCSQVDPRKPFTVSILYRILEPVPPCRVGIILATPDGIGLFDTYDADDPKHAHPREPGLYESRCTIPGELLAPGRYFISINAGVPKGPHRKHFGNAESALAIDVMDTGSVGSHLGGLRHGLLRPRFEWEVRPFESGRFESRSVAAPRAG